MTAKKRAPKAIDVRAILERPVGRISQGGRAICAYEAAMRRAADRAANGNMAEAKRFLREMVSYGLLRIPESIDNHQYVLRVPKDWDWEEWNWMYDRYGPPPWPGEHDGLIPIERWKPTYGPRPRPVGRRRKR